MLKESKGHSPAIRICGMMRGFRSTIIAGTDSITQTKGAMKKDRFNKLFTELTYVGIGKPWWSH